MKYDGNININIHMYIDIFYFNLNSNDRSSLETFKNKYTIKTRIFNNILVAQLYKEWWRYTIYRQFV
jgi:hypothetical protein